MSMDKSVNVLFTVFYYDPPRPTCHFAEIY